jgi:hypothetical protein
METDKITTDVTQMASGLGDPLIELGLATVVLVIIIVLHGYLLGRASKFFSVRHALYTPATPRWRASWLTGITIAMLVAIHLFETVLWTVPILQFDILGNFSDAYYYVLETYTTLGEGNLTLPTQWRLVGPVIAISGLFTFGWTASVLVYVMNESGKLQADRIRAAEAEKSGGKTAGDR